MDLGIPAEFRWLLFYNRCYFLLVHITIKQASICLYVINRHNYSSHWYSSISNGSSQYCDILLKLPILPIKQRVSMHLHILRLIRFHICSSIINYHSREYDRAIRYLDQHSVILYFTHKWYIYLNIVFSVYSWRLLLHRRASRN